MHSFANIFNRKIFLLYLAGLITPAISMGSQCGLHGPGDFLNANTYDRHTLISTAPLGSEINEYTSLLGCKPSGAKAPNLNTQISFLYNTNNNLSKITHTGPRYHTEITYTYNNQNKIKSEHFVTNNQATAPDFTRLYIPGENKCQLKEIDTKLKGDKTIHKDTVFSYNDKLHPCFATKITTNGKTSNISYTWNPSGLIASQTVDGQKTSYTYNTKKQLIKRTNPDGSQASFHYDNQGRYIGLKNDTTGKQIDQVIYNPSGNLSKALYPSLLAYPSTFKWFFKNP